MKLNAAIAQSDAIYDLSRSPGTLLAFACVFLILLSAIFAPWIAPQNPLDLASLELMNALKPPAFLPGGELQFPLGTDNQGRDVLSAIFYGTRVSLIVGFTAVVIAATFGTVVGMIAGYFGGVVDAVLMRLADIQLTFPSLMIALLINGVARVVLPEGGHENIEIGVVIFAISVSEWPKFARTARGSTLVECDKEYILAARIMGASILSVGFRHILPNIASPLAVIAMLSLGMAILSEATLSFLGVGVPAAQPSLGTMIRIGNNYIFSGEWWIAFFPALVLTILVVSVNFSGDFLRKALVRDFRP